MLWEIFSNTCPDYYEGMKQPELAKKRVEQFFQFPNPDYFPKALCDIINGCCEFDSTNRLNSKQVLNKLKLLDIDIVMLEL